MRLEVTLIDYFLKIANKLSIARNKIGMKFFFDIIKDSTVNLIYIAYKFLLYSIMIVVTIFVFIALGWINDLDQFPYGPIYPFIIISMFLEHFRAFCESQKNRVDNCKDKNNYACYIYAKENILDESDNVIYEKGTIMNDGTIQFTNNEKICINYLPRGRYEPYPVNGYLCPKLYYSDHVYQADNAIDK